MQKDTFKSSNPFIYKTPVAGNSFFGRGELLNKIFLYIINRQPVSLVGERRSGKTSILHRIIELKEQYLDQADRHVFALQDFSGIDYDDLSSVWITILNTLEGEMKQTRLNTRRSLILKPKE